MLPVIAAITVVLLIAYIWNKTRSRLTHIPGPGGIPILGNSLDFSSTFKTMHNLQEWSEKYGDIFKVNLFGEEIVVVSGTIVGEMLVTKGTEFAGRPTMRLLEKLEGDEVHLVLRDYDPKLRFIRKLAHKGLKQYGQGLDRIEAISLTEISKCLDKIEKLDGADFDPYTYIHHAISQVMNTMVTGEAVPEGHPMLNKAVDWDRLDGELSQDIAMFLPGIEKLASFAPGFGRIKEYSGIMDYFIDHWRSYEATYDKENPRGLYDVIYKAYLESETSEEGIKISYNNVKYLMFELYGAGITTTHKSIYAFVHLMVTHPELQKRIQAQIDEVVGSRSPTVADKHQLPLLEATIHEVLRYISHLPIALPHETKKDTSLGGYALPNKTQVWPLMSANHHNAKFFPDPWTFNPDRFLEEDGSLSPASSRKMLTPFGAGTRNCIGEVFARTRLYLFTANLLQRFTLLHPSEGKLEVLDPRSKDYLNKIPHICPSFKIRAVPR